MRGLAPRGYMGGVGWGWFWGARRGDSWCRVVVWWRNAIFGDS